MTIKAPAPWQVFIDVTKERKTLLRLWLKKIEGILSIYRNQRHSLHFKEMKKCWQKTGIAVYILPNANTQNRYKEAWNDTFDVFLPFAIFCEPFFSQWLFRTIVCKVQLPTSWEIFTSPLTLLENRVLSRKLQWKLFFSSDMNSF